jgi:hypothetical protein
MKLPHFFFRHGRCAPLSAAVLIALLQRTPVPRLAVAAGEALAASPLGAVLRPALAGLASLGAVHTLAGATQFTFSRNPPLAGTVGAVFAPLAFTVTGAGVPPGSFRVTGLPPGLAVGGINGNGVLNASTGIISGTPTQAGTFEASILAYQFNNAQGDTYGPALVTIVVAGGPNAPPAFAAQPEGQTAEVGASVTFSASVTGSPVPALQWRRNGSAIAGATTASLVIASVIAADAGDYTLVATNSAGTATSNVARLTVTTPPPAIDPNARLSNLSVRTPLAAAQTLIVGVVVGGGSREVLVRAAGPALASFGLAGAMVDPRLELFSGATSVFTNDDWPAALAPTFLSVGAFAFPNSSRDAAFLRPLSGAASVQARGTGAGVLLVEAYDTGAASAARLVNVSARNFVGTGDNILIAGFNITGAGGKRLLVRAVGPTLGTSPFNVPGVLADPVLEIYSGTTLQVSNDNWSADLAATFTAVGAFQLTPNSRDAALVAVLAPGSYTAQVRGAANGTGEALIEIYEVP